MISVVQRDSRVARARIIQALPRSHHTSPHPPLTEAAAPSRCVACRSATPVLIESATVREIADQWALDPSMALVAGRVRAEIEIIVGRERVEAYRCGACGLEMLLPGATWTGDTYPRQGYYLAFDHEAALSILAKSQPLNLLELGCGDGLFLEAAGRLGHSAVGLDFVPSAVEAARARGLRAELGDVGALQAIMPDQTFDAICAFQIFEHVAAPDALLEDLSAVTRPGARLMIGVPSPDRYTRRLAHAERVGSSDYWDWPPQHALRWTSSALEAALSRSGWRVDEVRPEPFSLLAGAATLTAIDGKRQGWYGRPIRRRLEVLRAAARLAGARVRRPITGTRLFVAATRL
jgi:SAM-dependent methyltransferase